MIMLIKTRYKIKKNSRKDTVQTVGPDQGIYPEYSQGEHWPQLELRHIYLFYKKKKILWVLFIYLFV